MSSNPMVFPLNPQPKSSKLSPVNLAVGAGVSLFEVTTLGQPFEVLKTHMAANRKDSLRDAIRHTMSRGGLKGFYQGLIPWAWIESGTTGAILIWSATAVESFSTSHDISPGSAGLLGGIAGGAAQAYLAMGVCTTMKTAEITRMKTIKTASSVVGQPPAPQTVPSTWRLFSDTYKKEGIRGINKGVNAVAIRQMTNWGSRMGITRLAESLIREYRQIPEKVQLTPQDKILSAAIGGALGCWNHPIEVVRVEMQSLQKTTSVNRPAKLTVANTFAYIYKENGLRGLFRGVTPRVMLGVWRTICLVSVADYAKEFVQARGVF
ncbi:mitochondrial carrier protein [Pseudohyphozyma bogoriensis]|nr:mitochondrial carrier protein [Pseudohyphozyma bogoriensis]